jgi:hypothetical protein
MLAVVVVAGWLVVGAAADTPHPVPTASAAGTAVPATVGADGVPVTPGGDWTVAHPDTGHYWLTFPDEVRVDVRSWDVPARVTLRPIAAGTWAVSFAGDDGPVDTEFSFLVSPVRP